MNNYSARFAMLDVVDMIAPPAQIVGVHFHTDRQGKTAPFYDLLIDGQVHSGIDESNIGGVNRELTAQAKQARDQQNAEIDSENARAVAMADQDRNPLAAAVGDGLSEQKVVDFPNRGPRVVASSNGMPMSEAGGRFSDDMPGPGVNEDAADESREQ